MGIGAAISWMILRGIESSACTDDHPPNPTLVCHTVSLGTTPGKDALKGVPTFGKGKGKTVEKGKGEEKGDAGSSKSEEDPAVQGVDSMAKVASQTATIMSLFKSLNPASKTGRVWL